MTGRVNDPEDWVEFQQNQIDEAAEEIDERRQHIGEKFSDGILNGGHLNSGRSDLQAYLEGYADGLGYAQNRVTSIDNLAKYLVDRIEREDAAEADSNAVEEDDAV